MSLGSSWQRRQRRTVNVALETQAVKLAELRTIVVKELGMHACMEEVRANEKKLMQYNRDMNAVTRGNLIPIFTKIKFSIGRQGRRWLWWQEVARPSERPRKRTSRLRPRRPGRLAGAAGTSPTTCVTHASVKSIF